MGSGTFRIIYCSRNSIDPSARGASIEQILTTSRRNNARDGVTGALLYNDGLFVQTLEGEFEAVQAVFERIQSDDRHQDVVILQAETVDAPMFAAWAMAFAEAEDKASANQVLSQAIVDRDDGACQQVLALLNTVVRHVPEWARSDG